MSPIGRAIRSANCKADYTEKRHTSNIWGPLLLSLDFLIVTTDYDFGEIAVRDRRPVPGIVILAPSAAATAARAARLIAVVLARGETLRGTLTLVEDRRLRVRALERGRGWCRNAG